MFFVIRTPLLGRVDDIICTHYVGDPRFPADRIAIYKRARRLPDVSIKSIGESPKDPPVTYSKAQVLAMVHALINLANTLPDDDDPCGAVEFSFNDEFIPRIDYAAHRC